MKSKKQCWAVLSVLVALLMLAGCAAPAAPSAAPSAPAETQAQQSSAAAATETPSAQPTATPAPIDPMAKYPETIELTTDTVFAGWMQLEDGEDQDNNWWTKIYLDKLNIKLTNKWAASEWGNDMDQKFNQALASDDLPDLIYAYTSLAAKCIKNNKVADIKPIYDQYASDQLRAIYALDPNSLKAWEVDGKLYGLTNVHALPGRMGFWIRKDWLDKLGLPEPKTMADIENVMTQFMQKNPGNVKGEYGFGCAWDSAFMDSAFPLFNIVGGDWLDVNGQLQYDKIQPTVKALWQKAADWYKAGILPKDFAVKKSDPDINQDITTGKCGVWFGYSGDVVGTTAMLDLKKQNPDLDFVFVYPPAVDGNQQKLVVSGGQSYGDVKLLNAKCEHPEAFMKIVNLGTSIFNEPKPDYITDMSYQHGATGKGWAEFWRCFGMSCPSDPFQAGRDQVAAQEALKTGDTSKLTFIAKQEYYDKMKAWLDKGKADENWGVDWATYRVSGPDGTSNFNIALNESKADYTYSPWYGMDTEAMTKNGQSWFQKYREFRTNAITNNDVDKQFDAWVAFFHENGGDQATSEVNAWYATHK